METALASSVLFCLVVLSCYAAHFSGQLSARVSAYSEESVKGTLRTKASVLYGTSRFGLSCAILSVIDAALPLYLQQSDASIPLIFFVVASSLLIATLLVKVLTRNGHRSIPKSKSPPELS